MQANCVSEDQSTVKTDNDTSPFPLQVFGFPPIFMLTLHLRAQATFNRRDHLQTYMVSRNPPRIQYFNGIIFFLII
jgi:hypothetical protein